MTSVYLLLIFKRFNDHAMIIMLWLSDRGGLLYLFVKSLFKKQTLILFFHWWLSCYRSNSIWEIGANYNSMRNGLEMTQGGAGFLDLWSHSCLMLTTHLFKESGTIVTREEGTAKENYTFKTKWLCYSIIFLELKGTLALLIPPLS